MLYYSRKIRLKTWHFEYAFVIIILSSITYLFANNINNWIATLAVCITFGYSQISDRLIERQQALTRPDVECYWKLNYYFWAKEIIWVILFIKLESYAALGGCLLFGLYPFWRKFYRNKIKPVNVSKFFVDVNRKIGK